MQASTNGFELKLVASGQVDIAGVVVGGATVEVSVLERGVSGLNSLLREGEIAARDGV